MYYEEKWKINLVEPQHSGDLTHSLKWYQTLTGKKNEPFTRFYGPSLTLKSLSNRLRVLSERQWRSENLCGSFSAIFPQYKYYLEVRDEKLSSLSNKITYTHSRDLKNTDKSLFHNY